MPPSFLPAPLLPCLPQFYRVGKLRAHDPQEVFQPDTRLRLGVGVKASGVGGKTFSAGGWVGVGKLARWGNLQGRAGDWLG